LHLPSGEFPVAEFDRPDEEVPEFLHLPLISSDARMMTYQQTEQHAWFARSDQISLMEMLEVQLINVTAPFLLNSRLKPAMLRSPNRNRFIINVSAMEGKFNTKRKGRYHVHTNMAKASLNMMTLTMAKEYKRDRIFITSVDPGWVSNQIPGKEIKPPLSFEDAAARICDPIYEGKDAEQPVTGVFLKDYRKVDW
jgi:NAD(P)-dependent dehydrogenase (short-subunit alcohol dehydrogenase family)